MDKEFKHVDGTGVFICFKMNHRHFVIVTFKDNLAEGTALTYLQDGRVKLSEYTKGVETKIYAIYSELPVHVSNHPLVKTNSTNNEEHARFSGWMVNNFKDCAPNLYAEKDYYSHKGQYNEVH